MTWLDILLLVVFIVFAVLGFARGLIAEVFSLLSWVAALYMGAHYGEIARPLLEGWVTTEKYQGLIACLLVGILTFAVVSVVGALLGKSINASIFAPINRMLGLLFGAARGAIVIALLTLLGLQFGLAETEIWKASKLSGAATISADLLDSLVDFDALLRQQSIFDRPSIPT